ncbi:MAG: DUF5667 domain-containing protein [Patescibacteria group bacterium]|nr:DUF5667 domain-containing protein [Patescibacteria group bacterium]
MKKQIIIFFVFIFSFWVVSNFLFFSQKHLHAKEAAGMMPLMQQQESTTGGSIKKKSDYILPYPGILPDHPLYFLKELRDKIIEMLIVDPERKSEFYLLQSDKLLNSAVSLLEKGNSEKAKDALKESSGKMSSSVGQLSTIKAGGKVVTSRSIDRILNAVEKHIEVLQELSSKIDTAEFISSREQSREELMKLK